MYIDIYTSKSASFGADFEKYIYTGKRQFALYKKTLNKKCIYTSKWKTVWRKNPKSIYILKYIYTSKPLYPLSWTDFK